MQIFGQNGGKPVGRYRTNEQLLGEDSPEMVAIIEFDNQTAIQHMVAGEAFTDLADLRAKAFSKLNMMICGNM